MCLVHFLLVTSLGIILEGFVPRNGHYVSWRHGRTVMLIALMISVFNEQLASLMIVFIMPFMVIRMSYHVSFWGWALVVVLLGLCQKWGHLAFSFDLYFSKEATGHLAFFSLSMATHTWTLATHIIILMVFGRFVHKSRYSDDHLSHLKFQVSCHEGFLVLCLQNYWRWYLWRPYAACSPCGLSRSKLFWM